MQNPSLVAAVGAKSPHLQLFGDNNLYVGIVEGRLMIDLFIHVCVAS